MLDGERHETAASSEEVSSHMGEAALGVESEVLSPELLAIKESILAQLDNSYSGYSDVMRVLNSDLIQREHYRASSYEEAAEELDSWLTKDRLSYIKKQTEKDPSLNFTLVITPNAAISSEQLSSLTQDVAERLKTTPVIYKDLYDKYTPVQLAGNDPEDPSNLKFCLIPNKNDDSLSEQGETQKYILKDDLQANQPFLNIPSPFQSIASWYVYLANGIKLTEIPVSALKLTGIRHINMKVKEYIVPYAVPFTAIYSEGTPRITYASVDAEMGLRVAVT